MSVAKTIFSFVIVILSVGASLAWGAQNNRFTVNGLAIKVTNLPVAQTALTGGALYLQDARLVKPDKIDFTRPYCYSMAYHFRLQENTLYKVVDTRQGEIEGNTFEMVWKLDPASGDAFASFRVACFTRAPTTLNDMEAGLVGVYEIVPTAD